jgi:putative endonuclease
MPALERRGKWRDSNLSGDGLEERTGARRGYNRARESHTMPRTYFVYMLASRSRSLYVGVTSSPENRIRQHREGLLPGFTARYRVYRLVYFEVFGNVGEAIAREKEIKGWRREKKIALIERYNPTWEDLAQLWEVGRARPVGRDSGRARLEKAAAVEKKKPKA